jgi:hypothetical protein
MCQQWHEICLHVTESMDFSQAAIFLKTSVTKQPGLVSCSCIRSEHPYPNPAKAGASFYIDGITEATVSVYNVLGQNIPVTVMSQGNAIQVIPTAALSQGVYLVTVTTAGKTAQVKWIVE